MTRDHKPFETDNNWMRFTFEVNPVVDYRMRHLCTRPYPGHKKGCPKFNKGYASCPPIAPLFDRYFEMTSPIFAIVNEFNIKAHMVNLAIKHPKWTEQQLRCCLYWQSTARKQLAKKSEIVLALDQFKNYQLISCPEAMGVNVTETMSKVEIILEWPPVNIVRQIALLAKINNDLISNRS